MTGARPALFLGLDGAIDAERIAATVAAFRSRGWRVFVLSNQPEAASLEMLAALPVDRVYVASQPGSFDWKPKPGMLWQAMTDFAVERERSLLIGETDADIAAARAVGMAAFLFTGGDLAAFAEWALADVDGGR